MLCRVWDPCCHVFQDRKKGGWKSRHQDPIPTCQEYGIPALGSAAAPQGMVSGCLSLASPPWGGCQCPVRPVKRPDYRDRLPAKSRPTNLGGGLRIHSAASLKVQNTRHCILETAAAEVGFDGMPGTCRCTATECSSPSSLPADCQFHIPPIVWSEPSVTISFPVVRLFMMLRRTHFPLSKSQEAGTS